MTILCSFITAFVLAVIIFALGAYLWPRLVIAWHYFRKGAGL